MADDILIQVGEKTYGIESSNLPPVGTQFYAHKHLHDGDTSPLLEVVAHEWHLQEPSGGGNAYFEIKVVTKIVLSKKAMNHFDGR